MLVGRTALALLFAAASLAGASRVSAADRFFMFNLTAATTFTGVYLAPAGSVEWGANQALNDKDKAIDPNERLPIKDISRGRFDVKLVGSKGRTCFARNVDLTKETTFEVRDRDLKDCK